MNIIKNNIKQIFQTIVISLLFLIVSFYTFTMTGNIIKPLAVCFLSGFIIALVTCSFQNKECIIGASQLTFILILLFVAIIKELFLQIENGWTGEWIYFFYFDKFLTVGSLWLSSTLFFVIKRLLNKDDKNNYKHFFFLSSTAFIIFYTFLLVYSFILIRLETGTYPINLVPFSTIKEYYTDYATIPYEVFMMFFGNLLYFTPLGYIFYILLRKKRSVIRCSVILIFPIVAFSLLELSQFIFQNGFCEIDDMLMNSIGFWFGAILGKPLDKLGQKISRERIKQIWC